MFEPNTACYREGKLPLSDGTTAYRWYSGSGVSSAIWFGGAGGGWDTPANQLYPRLCEELTTNGIHSLRVRFRNPHDLHKATADVRAGIRFLAEQNVSNIALIGHSFGGAVAIRAAAAEPIVRTVVALATQSYGAEVASALGPRCSLLLIHGLLDSVLPWRSSQVVFDIAQEPKRLLYLPDAGHGLDEAADQVRQAVRDWLVAQLAATTTVQTRQP
jgi:pimeloyl-ACP methyl ester carboxylesterase